MKKLFVTVICALVCVSTFAQQKKEAIYVSVISNQIDESLYHTIEDIFHSQLQDYYDVRLVRESGVFSEEKRKELAYQESGAVLMDEIKEYGNERGVSQLCVISVETQKYDNSRTEYYFRAKIFDLESGQLKKTAIYPDIQYEDEAVFEIHSIRTLQRISSLLIARLGINKENMINIANTARIKEDKENQAQIASHKSVVRKANGKALAYSLIPGVGLMMKGHKAEGVVYMIGDVALLGGGFAFMSQANKQKDIMNSHSTGIDQYKLAEKKYNNATTASYCCFGVAAVLYGVNLIRAYCAKPKPNARLQWAFVPSAVPSLSGSTDMGISFALCYNF